MSPSILEFSPALAALYAFAIYAFMLLVARCLIDRPTVIASITPPDDRYGSVDGLRGLLASGVMVHHSFAAYGYFSTGEWKWSASPILNQLGQTTVALFFMITGFLFSLKAASTSVRWGRLYISRLARLGPLYAVVVCVVFALVFIVSNGEFNESPWEVAKEFWMWMSFVCFGRPDINGFPLSWTLIAGVNWTLKYEVLFYLFGVPAIHFATRHIGAAASLAGTLLLMGGVLLSNHALGGGDGVYAVQFLSGMAVAQAVRLPALHSLMRSRLCQGIGVLALLPLMTMTHSQNALGIASTVLIFAAIVGGGSIFGLLNLRPAIWLGDISYGIYLIHGLVLWIALSIVTAAGVDLAGVSLAVYLPLVMVLAAIVVLLASLSYIKLEKPFVDRASAYRRGVALAPFSAA